MWVGGVVVSQVKATGETWAWLVALLGLHLWANWMAVKSVRLTTLNRMRAGIVLGAVTEGGKVPSIEQVGEMESVFGRGDVLRSRTGEPLGFCGIGQDMRQLLNCMRVHFHQTSGSAILSASLERLSGVFEQEDYLLWFDTKSKQVIIVLKQDASSLTQLKAWCHASRLVRSEHNLSTNFSEMANLVDETLRRTNVDWEQVCSEMKSAGWDLPGSSLECAEGHRVMFEKPD